MILNYITLFSVGKDSEALIIDLFERTEELIVWDSREQYFEARQREPEVIDGGVYSYWMVAATSAAPDDLISNRIVSFLAPPARLFAARYPPLRGESDEKRRVARMARLGVNVNKP